LSSHDRYIILLGLAADKEVITTIDLLINLQKQSGMIVAVPFKRLRELRKVPK
jgi:hypothetical protein